MPARCSRSKTSAHSQCRFTASTPSLLVNFNGFNGQYPFGGLIADASGNLFGTTAGGGVNNAGTMFEIKNIGTLAAPIYSSTPTTLVSFNNSNGSPFYGVTMDASGNLFGTITGNGNNGSVFEIQNAGTLAAPVYASSPTTLASVGIIDAGLIVDANGNLFGTTETGGSNNAGTVFEYQNIGTLAAPVYASTPSVLVNFKFYNGQDPLAGLIADANGDLFGTTSQGGALDHGTVFEIKNIGTAVAPVYASNVTTLVSFNGSDGSFPVAGLIADARGNLFGTTNTGGEWGVGTVFEIQNTGTLAAPVYASSPTTLVTFNGSNGANPHGALIADVNGNLFGTTAGGGGGARPDMAARRSKSPVLASRYRYLRRLPEPLVARRRPRKRR